MKTQFCVSHITYIFKSMIEIVCNRIFLKYMVHRITDRYKQAIELPFFLSFILFYFFFFFYFFVGVLFSKS